MRVGLIRVLTTSDRRLLHAHGKLLQETFGFTVTSRSIPDQPHGVYDEASHGCRAKGRRTGTGNGRRSGCADNQLRLGARLAETRALVGILVIGAGSAAAAAALAFGGRVGVLGLRVPAPVSELLGERMVLIDGPESVETPDAFLMPTGIFDALAAAQMLVDAGADVIVQASTGLSSIGMAEVLRRKLGVPVIDAVTAAGSMLASALAARELQKI